MHFCGLRALTLKQFLKVTDVNSGGRRAEETELRRTEEDGKKGRENNEGSGVDNNERDEVQMLIKCFGRVSGGVSLVCWDLRKGSRQSKTLSDTHKWCLVVPVLLCLSE